MAQGVRRKLRGKPTPLITTFKRGDWEAEVLDIG
jgi:hypothetical protein